MKIRKCHQCGKEKLANMFARDRTVPDGRSRRCKVCQLERWKKWRQENMGLGVGKMPGTDYLRILRKRP